MDLAVDFGPVTDKNINQFKEICKRTLAVKYSPQFYQAILTQWNKLTWLCYVNDLPVAAISARVEPRNEETSVYVMTCSVLEPYRRQKIARRMMDHLFDAIKEENVCTLVYLNVWVASQDAVVFYKSLGFVEVETLEDYYKELEPPNALVLEYRIANL